MIDSDTESEMLDEIHDKLTADGHLCIRDKLVVKGGIIFYDGQELFSPKKKKILRGGSRVGKGYNGFHGKSELVDLREEQRKAWRGDGKPDPKVDKWLVDTMVGNYKPKPVRKKGVSKHAGARRQKHGK